MEGQMPRKEWHLWRAVAPAIGFQLDFADTGTLHPDLTDPPGIGMINASVSARYTIDDNWIVRRGRPQSGRTGLPMATQYRGHAVAFAADPHFGGLPNCWADAQITAISGGAPRSGNRTTWATIGLNRHLSLVADRLP